MDEAEKIFENERERDFCWQLLKYVIQNKKPETSPTIWQDAEILIRHLNNRGVPTLSERRKEFGEKAITTYSALYVINHMPKSDILDIIIKFLKDKGKTRLSDLFAKKLGAPVRDFIVKQKKRIIKRKDLKNEKFGWNDRYKFDELFEYPAWIEFDDEVFDDIAEEIYFGDTYSDRILYFLGVDGFKNYDKMFYLAKHIAMNSWNFEHFYIAGDILNIIWQAIDANDEKTNKWYQDQIFEIYWSRVGSVDTMMYLEDMDIGNRRDIIEDAIGWLKSVDDLRERLPDLPEDFVLYAEDDGCKETEKDDDAPQEEREKVAGMAEHLKHWPEEVSPFKNPEFLNEVKLEYIMKAVCERKDPYYESCDDTWYMRLGLLVDGKKCEVAVYDQTLYDKYRKMIEESGEFDCESEIPMQYGRETFRRKSGG